jgi:hypothetical protein
VTHAKYVRLADVEAHLALGWLIQIEDRPCHHQNYSLILKWICQCPIREPTSPRPLPTSSPSGDASEASR